MSKIKQVLLAGCAFINMQIIEATGSINVNSGDAKKAEECRASLGFRFAQFMELLVQGSEENLKENLTAVAQCLFADQIESVAREGHMSRQEFIEGCLQRRAAKGQAIIVEREIVFDDARVALCILSFSKDQIVDRVMYLVYSDDGEKINRLEEMYLS